MNKKFILSVLIIFLGIILLVLLLISQKFSSNIPLISHNNKTISVSTIPACDSFTGVNKTTCEKQIIETRDITKIVTQAISQGNPTLCDIVTKGFILDCKDYVYLEIAMKSKKMKDCEMIQNKQKQSVCKDKLRLIFIN